MPHIGTFAGAAEPKWLQELAQRTAQRAEAVSNRPFAPYHGPRVAPFGHDIEHAHQMGREVRMHAPYYQEAHAGFREASKTYPEQHHLYHNPHEDQVVKQLIRDTRQGFGEQTLPDIASHFVHHGHHGSSRHRDVALRAQHQMEKALSGQVHQARAHGFETGHTMHSHDLERRARTAQMLSELGARTQASNLADVAALESMGEAQRQQQQQMMDARYAEYLREMGAPGENLAELLSALQAVPYSKSTYSVQHNPPAPRVNTMGQIGSLAGQLFAAGLGRGRG